MTRRPPLTALLYGLLLAAMVVAQIASFDAFEDALRGYDVLGDVRVAAVALLGVQAFAAVGLLFGQAAPRLRRAAGVAGIAVALTWAALAVQAFVRGLELDNCGCFGAYLAQPLRWWVLLEDAYMVVLAVLAARSVGVPLPSFRPRGAVRAVPPVKEAP
jgi:hypothetical protein